MDMDETRYRVVSSARVGAPADRVYRILSDYRNGHPNILPAAFSNFVVEAGGVGAGTLTRFDVRAFGRTQSFRHEVLEPEPGRVLVERDRDLDSRTTFTVEPAGAESIVTISSELRSRPGLGGRLERWLSRRFLTGLYREELAKLDAFARRA
jgi:Polyketide cyclase / dehydrase and lipid transport